MIFFFFFPLASFLLGSNAMVNEVVFGLRTYLPKIHYCHMISVKFSLTVTWVWHATICRQLKLIKIRVYQLREIVQKWIPSQAGLTGWSHVCVWSGSAIRLNSYHVLQSRADGWRCITFIQNAAPSNLFCMCFAEIQCFKQKDAQQWLAQSFVVTLRFYSCLHISAWFYFLCVGE